MVVDKKNIIIDIMNIAELQPRLPAVLRAIFNCFPAQRSLPFLRAAWLKLLVNFQVRSHLQTQAHPTPTLLKLSPYSMELNRAIENSSKSSHVLRLEWSAGDR